MNQTIIDQRIDEFLAGPMPLMQAFALDLEGSGEEYIALCRGHKLDFEGAEHFWLKARQKSDWLDRCGGDGFQYEDYKDYAASTVKAEEPLKYIPLSAQDFYEFINIFPCFEPLSEFLELDDLKPSYISGALTETKWNSRLAFAEFADEFVVFHWRTSA